MSLSVRRYDPAAISDVSELNNLLRQECALNEGGVSEQSDSSTYVTYGMYADSSDVRSHLALPHGQLLLVLASLVLEPDPDYPRGQPGHLHQLLFHQGVRTRVGGVAALQKVEL